MKFFVDNNDGLGLCDYTSIVDAEYLPQVQRKLNSPAQMTATLVSADPSFRIPSAGARVILQRNDGCRLFTGYLAAAPVFQYLGAGQSGAAWRYILGGTDDSLLLDRNALLTRTPFAYRTAGDVLQSITNDVLPGTLDCSGVQDLNYVHQFVSNPERTWSEHAAALAALCRAYYRVHDNKLYLAAVGDQSFTIDETSASFAPEALELVSPEVLRNDITILGITEPSLYVRDYFLGDGTTLSFYLSEQPYINTEGNNGFTPSGTGSSTSLTIFNEEYTAAQLDPTLWSVAGPAFRISGGKLLGNGGSGSVSYVEKVELAGGIVIQHGSVAFNAASTGTIGGLYNGAVSDGNCIAGFRVTPNGSNCNIQALINGSAVGTALTTQAGHTYSFTTRLYCNEAHRVHEIYVSSAHPAGNGRGGDTIAASLRVVLEVHDIDPANAGTIAAPSTVLYDDVLGSSPAFATYAVVAGSNLQVSLAFTRLQFVVDAEVRSLIPGQAFRTRLVGQLADGAECSVSSQAQLHFYPMLPPQPNEQIVVSYRSRSAAAARVQDQFSIATHAGGTDQGRRSLVRRLKLPGAPSSIDCENAALALLDDMVQPAWSGSYRILSDFLPASDVLPGNAVRVSVPSRGANFTAIVRETDLRVVSLDDDRTEYVIQFANDAASLMAFGFESATLQNPLQQISTTTGPSTGMYLAPLSSAQVTSISSTQIAVDAGSQPPSGGGIEVRRTDGGWGTGNDRNLAGRFSTQTFALPRLSRVQDYYLRQYDASSPPKYSRNSMLLHVDYPL